MTKTILTVFETWCMFCKTVYLVDDRVFQRPEKHEAVEDHQQLPVFFHSAILRLSRLGDMMNTLSESPSPALFDPRQSSNFIYPKTRPVQSVTPCIHLRDRPLVYFPDMHITVNDRPLSPNCLRHFSARDRNILIFWSSHAAEYIT